MSTKVTISNEGPHPIVVRYHHTAEDGTPTPESYPVTIPPGSFTTGNVVSIGTQTLVISEQPPA